MDDNVEAVDAHQADVNYSPSLLLTLPAEVRNIILAHVLTNHHIHVRYADISRSQHYFYHHLLSHDRAPPFPSERSLRVPARSREGQLTPVWRVCKQLHAETLHLPFCRASVFSFEDPGVFERFVQHASPEQVAGVRSIWIVDDNQSAMYMEVLGQRFAQARLASRLCDMTVYIQSRITRMEDLSNDPYSGPLSTHKTLRAGWDLSFERRMVSGLREMWEKLVENVVVKEV